MKRREFLQQLGGAAACALAAQGNVPAQAAAKQEWRNRQSPMRYRRLGRTGFMVSGFACGGSTISPTANDHIRLAVDMGVNYLDTARSYNGGRSELGYGALLRESSLRQRVFVASKVSPWDINRNRVFQQMFDSLPDSEKKVIEREVQDELAARPAKDSDYFGDYFSDQWHEVQQALLSSAMAKRYGDKVDRRKEYYDTIMASVEESLRRLNTDHLDILHCPHGATTVQEVTTPEIFEAFETLKKAGKVRYLGFSSHNDPAGTLKAAIEGGHYSVAMLAYSVINHEALDEVVKLAAKKDMGLISMKAARPVWPGRNRPPLPGRIAKLDRVMPGPMKPYLKGYRWALDVPSIAMVNSEMVDATMVKENLPLAFAK